MSFLNLEEPENTSHEDLSDENILQISLKNPEVFKTLLDRYQKLFLRKASSIILSKADAEDIVQETFTKIYLNAGKFKKQDGASFKSWGYKILINTSLSHYARLKKTRRHLQRLEETIYKTIEDPETKGTLAKKEMADYIARIMTELPKSLSRVLRLHILEGVPQKEIADIENISTGAVKTRIYRAKKEFRKIRREATIFF